MIMLEIEKAYTLAMAHAHLWTNAAKNPKQGVIMRGSGIAAQPTH
jgi:hypothetical protein